MGKKKVPKSPGSCSGFADSSRFEGKGENVERSQKAGYLGRLKEVWTDSSFGWGGCSLDSGMGKERNARAREGGKSVGPPTAKSVHLFLKPFNRM